MAGKTYSTDEVMAMMQAPQEDVQMLDKPASPFLDPAQINAAERELSNDPNFFVDQTPAPQRPDGGSSTLYPSKQETQPSLPKPVYTTDEVMALYTNESRPVYSTKDVMKQMIAPLYDPTAPRPSRDEYFKLKEMEKSLKESGDIEDPGAFEIGARAVGGLLVTAADALATATFKVDPKDALFTVGGIGVNPGKAIDDTLKRKDATVRLAGEFVKQQYNAMSEGLAAIGGPKYRVRETGEFITSMQQALGDAKMGQAGGMGGIPAADDSALIDRYKQQGLTLVPVGEQDLKDWEYLQWSKKMERNLAIEQAATTPRPPDVLYRLAAGLKPSVTDYITGRNDYAEAVAPVLANESQANVLSMAVDPMVWATSGVGATTRLGISAAAKGATAETLGILGKVAQKVVQPTEQALTKAEAFKKLVVSPAKVASAYGAASGVAWAADKLDLPSELKTAAFTAASLYGAYKAGVGVLRFTANKLPEASVILRESANATNGFDVAARKAVAANADVPYSIRERLLRPSQFVAMESTPARLAKNMELSPGTRAMMDKLSNWYVVQGVRGASAVATGAVKGAAASVPFAELMRSAGDEESAAAIYGMGAAFGSAGGAAERAFGAKGRRYAQAESDIARFLTDVQGNTTGLKDVKRYQWIDTEIGRLLTDVELGAGDVSALVKNRSFDELARTAAMQGFFRDRVDFVPLNAADFALNAKGHGADGSAGYFINAPDGQRPRIFVNVEARRADVEPHEFYEAFFSSDAFSPEQKSSMRAAVDNRYGADGLMARGREYAESLIKAENAKNFPNENLFVTSEQIAAKMDQLAQDELGRGGQDALDWVRREVMVEEARMAGIDYAAMRRNVPAGQNPITFIENLLGANARALGLSGVRVDPETGMAITPEQLFKENPVAAGDPKLVKQLNGYLKTYKQWLNDPQHETPKGTRIAPDGRAESLANNPNVKFYDGINGKENSIAFVDASGRVIEKTPKQRAKERKLRGQQIRNMVGSKILEPGNTTFGLKRWDDGRIRAGGKRLPDVMALQTHWKAHLPVIRSIEALSDAGESQQVLYFAKGNSADKVKSSRLSDIDAINREMVFDQWTTNAAGDLLAQFLDLTSVRNRAMKAIAERHPALDPANGGPGYSLQKIMDDVNQWMADKGAGKAGEATIGVPRKNVVNALINPGTNFNRGKNDLAGAFGRGSAIKTLLLENINAVSGTGRKGAAMDYAWANGNFMPDKPAPRPDMDGDLAPPRMPQALPREAQTMPDVPASGRGQAMPDDAVWDSYSESLRDDVESWSPARDTGRIDYEMMDVVDSFVDFARKNPKMTSSELTAAFYRAEKPTASQRKKLNAAIANVGEPPRDATGGVRGQAMPDAGTSGRGHATSDVSPQDAFEYAKRRHGTTRSIYEAGYILPDGTMLDFSGKSDAGGYERKQDGNFGPQRGQPDYLRDTRNSDHREIRFSESQDFGGNEAMTEFMRKGAVRVDANSGLISIHGRQRLTSAQKGALKDIVRSQDGAWLDLEDDAGNRTSLELKSGKWAAVEGLLNQWADGKTPRPRAQFMPDVGDVSSGLPRRSMESRGGAKIDEDGTVTFQGREPKDWAPEDFAKFGKEFGVRNLGPLSKVSNIVDELGRPLAQIPGGLDGKFTYYDLLWLKANPIDVKSLPVELHGKLTAKLARTMTPERGNDVQKFNGILFGMLSPNSPLLPNEFGQARMRFESMDDIRRFASLLPDNPTKEQRKAVNQRLKKELGFTSAKSGGLGIGISVDLSNIVMAAKMFVKKPEFFIKKPNESWANFVDKLTTQVGGLGTKTASFGGVWQDPLMAGISAMDRHMARAFSEELLNNPEIRGRFEGMVVKRFNDLTAKSKKTAQKADAKIRRAKTEKAKAKAIEDKQDAMQNLPDPTALKAETLDDVLGQAEIFGADRIKDFVNEAVFAAMGSRKAKYLVKGGAVNSKLPESLQGVEWVEQPKDFQVMSDAYRLALEINAKRAKEIGIEVFPSQWTLWDRIRGRVEPHEAMFPGLEKLPALNDKQLAAAYAANKQAGYARNVKAGQEWKRKSGLSPSSLAYFTPAVLAAGAASSAMEEQ